MGQISRFLRTHGSGLSFWCQACREAHPFTVSTDGVKGWQWNGDTERPVFSPSFLITGLQIERDENGRWNGNYVRDANGDPKPLRCHSFIGCNGAQPGQIIYLSDSSHDLAGTVVDLAPFPARVLDDSGEYDED